MKKFRQHLVSLFELNVDSPLWQKKIDRSIYLLILASSLGVILETLPAIKSNPSLYQSLLIFEDIAMAVFLIELLLRVFVINDLYAHTKTPWERFLLFFYLLIDFLAVLPAVLFALGSEHHDYFLTLRLLRVFKAFRHDDSVELVLRAIIIKKDILFKTAIIVVIMTVFLAVLLYEAENKFEFAFSQPNKEAQANGEPTKFTDIWASMIWCFSMFVGDLAGYVEGGFMPTTPLGRFIAGLLGFLNIAIVVIPTGIIASGFLEVLEQKKIEALFKVLMQAFRPKYNSILKVKLYERPRTVFTLQNALYIHQNNLFNILETKPGFRLRAVQSDDSGKYSDTNLVEFYGYGTLTEYGVKRTLENAKVTIICPDAFENKGIGYFAYAVSELHQAHLISNELFQTNSLNSLYDASFLHNPLFFEDTTLPHSKKKLKKVPLPKIAMEHFKQDVQSLAGQKPVWVFAVADLSENYRIQKVDDAHTQENDLFKWLAALNLEVYQIEISRKALDNYVFYELIAELSEQLKSINR
ncbi:MAG: ion transporter [Microscillaceae bacterium]|jgi:voltage-gated potassium channel|nr:ion transporter [Microscillaceae bacterium]